MAHWGLSSQIKKIYMCVYICIYIYIFTYMYVSIYIYTHTHTHTFFLQYREAGKAKEIKILGQQ